MIEELVKELHDGGFTLLICKDNEIRRFTGRGIADIYGLYNENPEFLNGSTIIDKVIGKGAASIMILSKPKEVYTDVISENALAFFKKYDVKVTYKELVSHIIRRDGNGWCPVELLCKDLSTAEEALTKINEFMKQQSK
ncbi:MAG: DUF1893 domain-containing protein [Rikenellaceae bacterium]